MNKKDETIVTGFCENGNIDVQMGDTVTDISKRLAFQLAVDDDLIRESIWL